jgi:uncharacterized membrane protein YciS (DUF1049 family)
MITLTLKSEMVESLPIADKLSVLTTLYYVLLLVLNVCVLLIAQVLSSDGNQVVSFPYTPGCSFCFALLCYVLFAVFPYVVSLSVSLVDHLRYLYEYVLHTFFRCILVNTPQEETKRNPLSVFAVGLKKRKKKIIL